MGVLMIPLSLLAMHFVADFIFQSRWMAENKSNKWRALSFHCVIYSVFFLWWGPAFAALTFVGHFVVDGVSSRITSYFWHKGERHKFFVVIGADQLVHAVVLAETLRFVGGF
jgi:hypothetical protein